MSDHINKSLWYIYMSILWETWWESQWDSDFKMISQTLQTGCSSSLYLHKLQEKKNFILNTKEKKKKNFIMNRIIRIMYLNKNTQTRHSKSNIKCIVWASKKNIYIYIYILAPIWENDPNSKLVHNENYNVGFRKKKNNIKIIRVLKNLIEAHLTRGESMRFSFFFAFNFGRNTAFYLACASIPISGFCNQLID